MTRKHTRPRDRITQASCLLITALLIMSAVSAGVGTGMASAEPAGMVSVPDQNITEDIPADALVPLGASQLHDGRILTDTHAMSLDVILTTPARAGEITGTDTASLTGDMALILRDTEHSAGRRVAIDSGLLQTALGYEPQAIYGTHENGEQWTATATYNDGYLVFDVPHFSTNTVTFSGSVDISMSAATDGTQAQYALRGNPSDPNVTFSGTVRTERETDTFSTTGGSISPDIAGNMPATDVKVTMTGKPGKGIIYRQNRNIKMAKPGGETEILVSDSLTGDGRPEVVGTADFTNDGTVELLYNNNKDPGVDEFTLYHFDTGNIEIVISRSGVNVPPGYHFPDVDNDGYPEFVFLDGTGDHYYADVHNGETVIHNYQNAVSISQFIDVDDDGNWEYVAEVSSALTIMNKGGVVNSGLAPSGKSTYSILGSVDLDGDGIHEGAIVEDGDRDYYVYHNGELQYTGGQKAIGDGPAFDYDGDGYPERVGFDSILEFKDGLYSQSTNNIYGVSMGTLGDKSVVPTTDLVGTENPQIDVDDDGTYEISHSGTLTGSKTVDIGSVDPSTDNWDVSVTGTVDITAAYTERTQTVDPSLSINGHTISHSGTLANGESVTLSGEQSWTSLSGDNTITVGTGAVSGDAPAPGVNVQYSHTATDKITVNYTATTFEERYQYQRTFADETTDVVTTIPFRAANVVGVRNVAYRIDGSGEGWQYVDATNYRLSNTTLDVYLSDARGGSFPPGATVSVKATGRRIDVQNGVVSILDATKPGDPLNTKLKIEQRDSGFAVNVGPTADGERIHYAYSYAYPTQDYVVIDGAGNQRLYLPESQPGDTFRMKHVRTKANVVAGDAKIRVVDPDDKKFEIMPGPGGDGDTVELTYYGAKSGNTYMLESLTREIILDTETANSPVTFVDDDSHEMWRILLESGGSGDTGGGGGLIGVASGAASSAGSAVSGLLPAISVPALGGIGGVGSAGFALILAGAVAVLVYGNVFGRIAGVIASLNPFGGTPASGGGADTGNGGIDTSGVTSALSGVVTRAGRVGGTAGVRVLRAATQLLTTSTRIIGRESARLARYLAANPSVALGLGGVGVAVAAYQGLVQLTPQATTAILIGSGGLITYLVLQRTGTFSWLSFGLIFGAFVILGAGAINPDVLASFGASLQDILPLLVIVGAYVVYRILQTRSQDASTPDTIVRFTGGGNGSDDNNN